MNLPNMHWSRISRLAVWGIAAFTVVWCVRLLLATQRWADVPIVVASAVFAVVYFWAVFFVLAGAVRRVLGRGPTPVPFVPGRLATDRRLWWALVGVAVLGTMWREGAFAPWSTMELSWYSATHNTHVQTGSNSWTSNFAIPEGAPGNRDSGPPVQPEIFCRPYHDAICSTIRNDLEASVGQRRAHLSVSVSLVGASSPLCYTPLVKSMHMRANADISVSAYGSKTTRHRSTTATITVDQTAWGVMSCLQFRRQLGHIIATKVRAEL